MLRALTADGSFASILLYASCMYILVRRHTDSRSQRCAFALPDWTLELTNSQQHIDFDFVHPLHPCDDAHWGIAATADRLAYRCTEDRHPRGLNPVLGRSLAERQQGQGLCVHVYYMLQRCSRSITDSLFKRIHCKILFLSGDCMLSGGADGTS